MPSQLMPGCQFGLHGEPFLWKGSGNDEIDLLIFKLIQFVESNPSDAAIDVVVTWADAAIEDARDRDGICQCHNLTFINSPSVCPVCRKRRL